MTSLSDTYDYVIGVDTHARNHMYAIVQTGTGALIGQPHEFRNTAAGHLAAVDWIVATIGDGQRWIAAIEGAGSYGKKVREYFTISGIDVTEVPAAKKGARRGRGKNDAIDAVNAARAGLARQIEELAQPRQGQTRDVLQVLLTIRRQDNRERTARVNMLNAIVRTCGLLPDTRKKLTAAMITKIATGTTTLDGPPVIAASAVAEATRIIELNKQIRANKQALREVVLEFKAELLDCVGVGPVSAARILCAWSHAGRFADEAKFASLAGASPIEIGSGGSSIYRLNYGGDRQLNSALHTIMLSRGRCDERTKLYIARRTAEGKSKRAIQRVLKRYIAREVFKTCEHGAAATTTPATSTATALAA